MSWVSSGNRSLTLHAAQPRAMRYCNRVIAVDFKHISAEPAHGRRSQRGAGGRQAHPAAAAAEARSAGGRWWRRRWRQDTQEAQAALPVTLLHLLRDGAPDSSWEVQKETGGARLATARHGCGCVVAQQVQGFGRRRERRWAARPGRHLGLSAAAPSPPQRRVPPPPQIRHAHVQPHRALAANCLRHLGAAECSASACQASCTMCLAHVAFSRGGAAPAALLNSSSSPLPNRSEVSSAVAAIAYCMQLPSPFDGGDMRADAAAVPAAAFERSARRGGGGGGTAQASGALRDRPLHRAAVVSARFSCSRRAQPRHSR